MTGRSELKDPGNELPGYRELPTIPMLGSTPREFIETHTAHPKTSLFTVICPTPFCEESKITWKHPPNLLAISQGKRLDRRSVYQAEWKALKIPVYS